MFEKEAEEIEKEAIKWVKDVFPNDEFKQSGISRALVEFAELGYNKANKGVREMSKEDMMNKISFALKDPILQMGFEVICSKLSRLEKENAELKEQCSILADCNTCHSSCKNENAEMKEQLTKAKELIKEMLSILPKENIEGIYEITEEAEQFLRKSE